MMHSATSASGSLSRKDQRITDTLFLNSVEDGNVGKIKEYLKGGANVNAKDGEGFTALHIAVDKKNLKVIKVLLKNGALPEIRNNDNETPLNIAQRLNELSIIRLFDPCSPLPKSISQKSEQICEINPEKRIVCSPGQKSSVNGHIYQLKLLMLFLYRGVSNQYSFRLGTEIEEAQKFDDLVFEYIEKGTKKYRLLQAKYRLSKNTITSADLLRKCKKTTKTKGQNFDYSLVKYFFSHLHAKRENLFKDGIIKDVIISTNIGLNLSDLKENGIEVCEVTSSDNILDFKGKAKRFRFTEKLVPKLRPLIEDCNLNKSSDEEVTIKELNHFIQKQEVVAEGDQTSLSSSWKSSIKRNTRCSKTGITDEDIANFLKCLVFAVNQPNEEELGQIIKNEIGQKFDLDLVSTENTYNKVFVFMLNWLQGKERGRFLSCVEGEELFQQAKRGMPILFNTKDPVSSFTGRVEQLNELQKALIKSSDSNTIQPVAVVGLGGVGKSELARKYISIHSQDYDNKVLWMNAESHSSLSKSFRRLALDKLGINTKNVEGNEKHIEAVVSDIYRFFSKGKSLFIFDNAEMYKKGISEFLPSIPENMNKPFILLTSRNQKWPRNVKTLQLNIFSETEAVEVVSKSLSLKNDAQKKDVVKLAMKLQFFPLALQQAIAYVKLAANEAANVGSEFSVSDYLEKYEEKTRELLDFSFPEDSDDNYTKTTLTTWGITLDCIKKKINGDEAIEVLNVMAYCAPENIPTDMFFDLVNDKKSLGSAFELLKQYSMIDLNQTTLNIHRLVQQVTRAKLGEERREEEVLRKALKLFKKDHMSSKYVDHALSICNHAGKYIELVQEFAPVTSYICCKLLDNYRFEEAYAFEMKALELFASLLPKNPIMIVGLLKTADLIGMALREQGKYDSALSPCHTVNIARSW